MGKAVTATGKSLLTQVQAASFLNLSPRSMQRHGVPAVRLSRKIVLYRMEDLEAWLEERSDARRLKCRV